MDAGRQHPAVRRNFGYDEITRQYHDRYRLPVMHTETNFDQGPRATRPSTGSGSNGPMSCACATTACPSSASPGTRSRTRSTGTPPSARQRRKVNPLGLYDLDRNIRPVGKAFKKLIAHWREVLPTQSVCLFVPVMLPSEYDEPVAARRREGWRRYLRHELKTKPELGS